VGDVCATPRDPVPSYVHFIRGRHQLDASTLTLPLHGTAGRRFGPTLAESLSGCQVTSKPTGSAGLLLLVPILGWFCRRRTSRSTRSPGDAPPGGRGSGR